MLLSELLKRLPTDSLDQSGLVAPDVDVYNICFLTPSACDLRQDVLYFGTGDLLPLSMPKNRIFSVVVYGDAAVPEHLCDNRNVNIAQVNPSADPFACYNKLQAYFIQDNEVSNIVQRMTSAHYSNNGLQFLVEEAAKALDNPIMVIDASYHYIAHHFVLPANDGSAFSTVLGRELQTRSVSEEGVAYIQNSRVGDELGRVRQTAVMYDERLGCLTMIGAVMVHGICIAHVTMAERHHSFGAVDRECFDQLVLLVAQEMQKTAMYEVPGNQMEAYFLVNLLGDEQPASAVIQRRLQLLSFKPLESLFVISLRPPAGNMSHRAVESVAGQLQGVLANSIYARYEGQLVALVTRAADSGLSPSDLKVLTDVARVNNLSVGISNQFRDMADVRRHYLQSQSAIRYGKQLADGAQVDSVYLYSSLAYVEMLEAAGRGMRLLDACDVGLLALIRHDEAHGTELTETLLAYLQSGCSSKRAADMLGLHKNTLLYRIKHVRDMLGCDLESGEDRFRLQLSYRILFHLGLLGPQQGVARKGLPEESGNGED